MKKILYIALAEFENPADGVAKKIHGQMQGMEELGYEVCCASYGEDGVYLFSEGNKQLLAKKNKEPLRFLLMDAVKKHLLENQYDMCYIRFAYVDFHLKSLLKLLKKKETTVYLEIASYPLEAPGGMMNKALYFLNSFMVRDMEKYLHKILYVGNQVEKIWKVRAEAIPNGCSVGEYKLKALAGESQEINLIVVATMLPHHGFERLLLGLGEYYMSGTHERKIRLHMVGEGVENAYYQQICREKQIEDYVTFWGRKSGEELDRLFDISHIAVASLGMYKGGFKQASLLKVKEYLARGIPFIYACEEIDLDKELPYACKLKNDASVIEIEKIIAFYDNIKGKDFRSEMREYVREKYSWRGILGNHLDEIV